MTPADFMNEIVAPTLREFRDDRRSRRRAFLACVAVFHVKDHLKKAVSEASRIGCDLRVVSRLMWFAVCAMERSTLKQMEAAS